MVMTNARLTAVVIAALLAMLLPAAAQDVPPVAASAVPEGFILVKTISHTGSAAWTDTGIEVKLGDEIYFEAEGSVSIQKNNPVAVCGPEGLSLRTMQQPILDKPLGCLIGMVVFRVDVVEDKETKEKTERRYGERFVIGKGLLAAMPETGRLMLGINENVTGDNEGEFVVRIYRKPAARG
jgi:hypothetical protein